jgi:phosphocarrier protein FPr
MTLGAREGHELVLRASGPDAEAALAALRELAEDGFGDEDGAAPVAATPPPAGTPAATPAADSPVAGGARRGIPVSSGIVIAPARMPQKAAPVIDDTPAGDDEAGRLGAARGVARRDIEADRATIAARAGEAEAGIFDAHLLLLDDAALVDPAAQAIAAGASAVAAWRDATAAVAETYRGLDDPYMRERAADVEDVGMRVLRQLGAAPPPLAISGPGILVVRDLTPADAAALDRDLVQGLAVARGGATSHAAILARALDIPCVVGLGDDLLAVADGTTLVLDGEAGTVDVDPPAEELAARERARGEAEERRARLRSRALEPARTRDGVTIEVAANVGSAAEIAPAVDLGADGVGLLRTEFLFLDRDEPPDEAEQRAVYAEIAERLGDRPLVIRTLDAGADKPLPFLRHAPEDNPFLGARGIRLSLAHPDLFRTQLRAILAGAPRAHIMFPMVATLAEYRTARELVDEVRAEVGAPPGQVGIMVEVPAVALAAEHFVRAADFFSVGTNDLSQYTMAAERGNEALAPLLAGPLPPVLVQIGAVTRAAEQHGRWVGVCGELAGDPAAAVLLAGLGVRELSMAAGRIPDVKDALRSVSLAEARAAAERATALDDADAARAEGAALI